MNEIVSSSVIVRKRFSFQKMLEIHQAVKNINGSVYLYSKQKGIDASSLPKLVSFLLTVEPQTTIKLLVEGTDIESKLRKSADLLANEAILTYQNNTQLLESSDSYIV